ncbi:MAG: hypothetical protein RL346_1752 [Verrucomicrobiota bacterium]|jgi:hypothetical protein
MLKEFEVTHFLNIPEIFSLAMGGRILRVAFRFSFVWRAVGAPVFVRCIFSGAIVGRKT